MKNKEIENDDYGDNLFATEEAFKRRFRRIEGNELTALKDRIARSTGEKKGRVTIYFDSDIIDSFKQRAKLEGIGYQTLMNETLRKAIFGTSEENLKESLLRDKKFLKRLKTALAA